jgi:hypothetical protein
MLEWRRNGINVPPDHGAPFLYSPQSLVNEIARLVKPLFRFACTGTRMEEAKCGARPLLPSADG